MAVVDKGVVEVADWGVEDREREVEESGVVVDIANEEDEDAMEEGDAHKEMGDMDRFDAGADSETEEGEKARKLKCG